MIMKLSEYIYNTSLHEDNLRLILNNSRMQHCQTLSLKYYCTSIRKRLLTIVFSFCWNCDLLCVCRAGTITFIKGVIVLWRLPAMSAKDMLSFSQFCLCQHCIVCWAGWLCCIFIIILVSFLLNFSQVINKFGQSNNKLLK